MGESERVGNSGARAVPPSILLSDSYGNSDLPRSAQAWAEEIKSAWASGATHTRQLAQTTFQAKQRMPRGSWARLWRETPMPFSKRKADMLVRIGRNLGEVDEKTFARLPRGWSVLYCLSLLGTAILLRLVSEGKIHPKLTLSSAKALLRECRGNREAPNHGRLSVRERIRKFHEFVTSTVRDWSPGERLLAGRELEQVLDVVTRQEGDNHPEPASAFLHPKPRSESLGGWTWRSRGPN